MRHLKLSLVAFAIMISSGISANPTKEFPDTKAVSAEVNQLLSTSCSSEKEFTVTIFFSISEDKKIQSISVASSNPEVNQIIEKKLANQELPGEFWQMGKIYELSVTRKMS